MRFHLALEKPSHMFSLRNVCFIVPIEDLLILTYLNHTHA